MSRRFPHQHDAAPLGDRVLALYPQPQPRQSTQFNQPVGAGGASAGRHEPVFRGTAFESRDDACIRFQRHSGGELQDQAADGGFGQLQIEGRVLNFGTSSPQRPGDGQLPAPFDQQDSCTLGRGSHFCWTRRRLLPERFAKCQRALPLEQHRFVRRTHHVQPPTAVDKLVACQASSIDRPFDPHLRRERVWLACGPGENPPLELLALERDHPADLRIQLVNRDVDAAITQRLWLARRIGRKCRLCDQ